MKFPLCLPLPLLSVVMLMAWAPLSAQTLDDDSETPPPGGTIITSDELHSDQTAHTSVFSGKVVVVGNQFKMTCQEMTVYFTKDNKVDHIVSTGDVVITQPDRVTHCGHAEYLHDADTFVLTDSPVILDHKDQIKGTRIIIDRKTQKMTTEGGRTTVTLGDQNLGAPAASAPATDAK